VEKRGGEEFKTKKGEEVTAELLELSCSFTNALNIAPCCPAQAWGAQRKLKPLKDLENKR